MSDIIPHAGVSNLSPGGLDAPLAARHGSPAYAPDLGFEYLPWMDLAACAEIPGDLFFPEPDDGATRARAIKICKACPVKDQCLERAFKLQQFHDSSGIWGGTSANERRRLRKGAAA